MKTGTSNKDRTMNRRLQRWALPLLLVFTALAAVIVIRFADDESRYETEEDYFQFFMEQRREYQTGTTLLPGRYLLSIEQDGNESATDTTPLYSEQRPSLCLTQDVCWVDPLNGNEWKLLWMTRLTRTGEGDVMECVSGKNTFTIAGGLLNDCRGTCVFLDHVKLSVNGLSWNLTPLSFCSAYGGIVRIYDYETGEMTVLEERNTHITAVSQWGYSVDLTMGIFTNEYGKNRLLSPSPENVPERYQTK